MRKVWGCTISIHALREEGDISCHRDCYTLCYFNPRPPRGGRRVSSGSGNSASDFNPRPPRGGRQQFPISTRAFEVFQSTPSARRATDAGHHGRQGARISIHALREEGDTCSQPSGVTRSVFQSTPSARRATAPAAPTPSCTTNFNPRPPRGGRRLQQEQGRASSTFQSTPSARRATSLSKDALDYIKISIHALREEGDSASGMR